MSTSEANLVRHIKLGIDIDITDPDLGHPDLPGLWTKLRERPITKGEIMCLGPHDAPEWIYLRVLRGVRQGVHLRPGAHADHASEGESDEHKALKARAADVAERAGLKATTEARAAHGKRITDVEIDADGHLLGVEFQLSRIGAGAIKRRADLARTDGLTPFWNTDNHNVPLQYAAPWSAIGRTTWHRIKAGTSLKVTGGVDSIETDRCGRRQPRCPVTKGRPCGQLHVYRLAARGIELDELIVGAATKAYLPLREPKSGGGLNYRWMRAIDLDRYCDDRGLRSDRPSVAKKLSTVETADLACYSRQPARAASCCGKRWPHTPGGPLLASCQLCPLSATYWQKEANISIKCGNCKERHPGVTGVRACCGVTA